MRIHNNHFYSRVIDLESRHYPGNAILQMGISGGEPGTRGAGLLTTGPHVHFEVIQNGVNVDPMTVLP